MDKAVIVDFVKFGLNWQKYALFASSLLCHMLSEVRCIPRPFHYKSTCLKHNHALVACALQSVCSDLTRTKNQGLSRGRIHERTISLRLLCIILRVFRLEVSKHFCSGECGNTLKSVSRGGDCEQQGGKLVRRCPITSKNSDSGDTMVGSTEVI